MSTRDTVRASPTTYAIPKVRNVTHNVAVRNGIANTDDADAGDKSKLHHLLRFGRIAYKRIPKEHTPSRA